jgi:N,N'-diacetyllegionaminate synthase
VKKTLIIAEAGVNHNGDFNLAKKLVDVAAEAGADIVKFQTFKAGKLVSPTARKAAYQIKNINDGDDSQFAMLKKLEMPEQWHYDLISYCKEKHIAFLSTGFDEESIDFLDSLGSPLFKIPSGEITNKPYLEHIARKGKPVILSTGMANLKEIEDAIRVMKNEGLSQEQISVLHCNTEYPTPFDDVNLGAMETIKNGLGVSVGYSDHTVGIEVPIAAVALGAQIIEKHFTLDRNLPGPDHKASLEPAELKAMVTGIRNIERALSGNGEKVPSKSEKKNIDIARKSLHYSGNLAAGHRLSRRDFVALRPGNGVSPMNIDTLVGLTLACDVDAYQQIKMTDLR